MHYSLTPMTFSGLAGWRLRFGCAQLDICQQGGQILSYFADVDQPPVIWLSEEAQYTLGQAVRGGVPICWPWFGDREHNPHAVQAMTQAGVPFHGFARTSNWQLTHSAASEQALDITLELDVSAGHQDWPHPAKLVLQVSLSDRLSVRLDNYNLGTQPLAISQALHSYFAVSDIASVSVQGFEQCPYHDCLQQWQAHHQSGAIHFKAETDRVYLNVPKHLSIVDSNWQRRIHLHTQGSHSAIVWNPWIDKARGLSGFADTAWQQMLCIETANVLDDHLLLNGGEHHQLALEISCTTEP